MTCQLCLRTECTECDVLELLKATHSSKHSAMGIGSRCAALWYEKLQLTRCADCLNVFAFVDQMTLTEFKGVLETIVDKLAGYVENQRNRVLLIKQARMVLERHGNVRPFNEMSEDDQVRFAIRQTLLMSLHRELLIEVPTP